jgi:predicted site-specific integrase-resolvase
MIKLSEYAQQIGLTYQTVWRHYKSGKIPYPTKQLATGTVLVDYQSDKLIQAKGFAAIYSRVSNAENKDNLDRQAERLISYAIAKGYMVRHVVKETGSGLNDNRKKLAALLVKDDYEILIVEHRDRLARFGTAYLELLLKRSGITLDIVNRVEDKTDDLMTDLVAIITSFAARLYGQRRGKRKTEKIIATLQSEEDNKVLSECS